MPDRELILDSIPRPTLSEAPPTPYSTGPKRVKRNLAAEFEEKLVALKARLLHHIELEVLCQRDRWVDPFAEELLGVGSNVESIWNADVGICRAFCAISDLGTVILHAGKDADRLTSLVPPMCVIVVERERIVATLAEALAMMPSGNVVFVTGPSRTTDIEGVPVYGVHGPSELLVYVK